MAAVFTVESVLEIVIFFQFPIYAGSSWVLFDGLVTLLLAFIILLPWSDGSYWSIEVVLGMDLMISGFAAMMYSLIARRSLEPGKC